MRERLWVVLLLGLMLVSVLASVWATGFATRSGHVQRVDELEREMRRMTERVVPELGKQLEAGDILRARQMVEELGRIGGGRAMLFDDKGVLLSDSGPTDLPELREQDRAVAIERDLGEILMWQPVRGLDGRRIGELRYYRDKPTEPRFSWSLWGRIFSLLLLASVTTVWLVTKVLAPMQGLGRFLRDLVAKGPLAVDPPQKGIADFERLREDIEYCIDGLRTRQLRVEEAFVELAIDLAREYEGRRGWDKGHGQRVRRYASWLGLKLAVEPHALDALEVAALCHDLGREGDREPELPGEAPHREHDHPAIGAALFAAVPGFEEVAEAIRHHHERWDGQGYPGGLQGTSIPLGGRILAIADAFDAWTSGKDGATLSPDEALERMAAEVGTVFDPALFASFQAEVARHRNSLDGERGEKIVALAARR
ncbi:MAG: HD domain-containing phosphohydrolase [Planctomycetota bacterium]